MIAYDRRGIPKKEEAGINQIARHIFIILAIAILLWVII